MRSSWFTRVSTEPSDKCLYRGEAEGHLRQRRGEREAA